MLQEIIFDSFHTAVFLHSFDTSVFLQNVVFPTLK